ncbi:MAG TPA: hypothetical protein VIL33_01460, partial [Rhodothermia bacterium]
MSLLTRKRTILAEAESTYGVDPSPLGSANAMLIQNLTVKPIEADTVQRQVIKEYLGHSDILLTQVSVAMDFEIEIAGAITKGIAPAYAPLLKACGFGETLNTTAVGITRSGAVATVALVAHGLAVGNSIKIAGATQSEYNGTFIVATVPDVDSFTYAVSGTPATPATGSPVLSTTAVYAPVSASFGSVTIYHNVDGVLHKLLGGRGNVEFDFNVKNIPVMKFSFKGLYSAVSDSAAPTCVFTAFQSPEVVSTSNTTPFSFFSHSGYMERLNINMANDIQYRTLVGLQEVNLTQRAPAGTLVIEAPLVATKDYFAIANAGT